MTDNWAKILRFWPVALGFVALVAAGVKVQFQVEGIQQDIAEIRKNRESEVNQWRRINTNGQEIVEHRGRLEEIEKHVTVEAVQAWGALRQQFREDHQDLQEHLRNHP
jgi:hypothetical protein